MDNQIVTTDRLKHLPEAVQRYLNYSGIVGKPWIDTVRLKYEGRFRLGADKPWLPSRLSNFMRRICRAFTGGRA